MSDPAVLGEYLARWGRVVLGYSGGVDSALLAVAGRRALGPERFLAVIGRSDSYPMVQYQAALAVARRFEIPLLELETRELDDPRYRANPVNRCYFCKTELWSRLDQVARARGFDVVMDGTHADDLGDHRPGLQAAALHRVRSPLAELGWTKTMVRRAARAWDIPVWDHPSSPCLSSRLRYGLEVTPERLRQVEAAESFLRSLGVRGDLRVRHQGTWARVEADRAGRTLLEAAWSQVEGALSQLGFERVELDPRGYRRGALLGELPVLPA
jgi:pyridinium-3,5-biscarboxylic acid mononucleotide sulfurtransferase